MRLSIDGNFEATVRLRLRLPFLAARPNTSAMGHEAVEIEAQLANADPAAGCRDQRVLPIGRFPARRFLRVPCGVALETVALVGPILKVFMVRIAAWRKTNGTATPATRSFIPYAHK